MKKSKTDAVASPPINPLDAIGIETICEMILDGMMITEVAARLKVGRATLLGWLAADSDRSARAREARSLSAIIFEEKAQSGLEDAADVFELSKAKEMAHHFRWKASKINPREYGDKLALGGASDLPPIASSLAMTDEQLMAIASRSKDKT